ncbi:MAG: aminotransferase class I/II-fold pyridoxal phosphate-dependent enzyme [Bacteroidota bacterium]
MTKYTINRAYDVDDFRKTGHALVDLLADHLQVLNDNPNELVIRYRNPDETLQFWQADLEASKEGNDNQLDFFRNVLNQCINVQHQRYMGHQVSVPAYTSALSGLMTDLLSNGTGVFEMGMASNAMERIVTDFLAKKIGFDTNSTGFLTSGGTLANLTAMLAARRAASADVWENGHTEKLGIMVSAEAHYCIDRAARIMGFGEDGVIKVPVDEKFRIDPGQLEAVWQKTKADGIKIIALVGCTCSTATGSFDNLEALAEFTAQKGIWFHVDAAHGGCVVFSKKYKHLARGIERADSVVVDFHKMLMTPSLNTALIFKRGEDSYKTFTQKAQYLWDAEKIPEWYHSGKRTFECTKLMMSIKVYSILRTYGESIFEENVDILFDNARTFARIIEDRKGFEIALEPEANIVNFRLVESSDERSNTINGLIRDALIESGRFFTVQTVIKGIRYLRTSIMHPFTTEDDFHALLDEIEHLRVNL